MFQFEFPPFQFQIDPWLIAICAISFVAFLAVTIIWGVRAHRHQVSAGREELVGGDYNQG